MCLKMLLFSFIFDSLLIRLSLILLSASLCFDCIRLLFLGLCLMISLITRSLTFFKCLYYYTNSLNVTVLSDYVILSISHKNNKNKKTTDFQTRLQFFSISSSIPPTTLNSSIAWISVSIFFLNEFQASSPTSAWKST